MSVPRILPRPTRLTALTIVHSPEQMRFLLAEAYGALVRRMDFTGVSLIVSAGAFFQRGIGVCCTSDPSPRQVPRMQGWVMRSDPVFTGPPAYVIEGSILLPLTHQIKYWSGPEIGARRSDCADGSTWEILASHLRRTRKSRSSCAA